MPTNTKTTKSPKRVAADNEPANPQRKNLALRVQRLRTFLLKHGWVINEALKKSPQDAYDYWVMPQAMFDQLPKTKAPNQFPFASSKHYDTKPNETYNFFFQNKIVEIFADKLQIYTRAELVHAFLPPAKFESFLRKYNLNRK